MQSLLDLIPMERINFHPIQVFQVLIQMTLKVSGKLSKNVPVAKFASHMCPIFLLFGTEISGFSGYFSFGPDPSFF